MNMATKQSERTMRSRKKKDQISFLAPHGCRELLRVLALRDELPYSDVLRNAVLDAACFYHWPSEEEIEHLRDVETKEEAEYAISWIARHQRR